MKAKIIYAQTFRDAEEKLNAFLEGKDVVDVKFSMNFADDEDHYGMLVLYRE